jgi:hypothetical protein
MSISDDICRWAIALPEVEETSHFRFHVPAFKVRGRTFLGMVKTRQRPCSASASSKQIRRQQPIPRHLRGCPGVLDFRSFLGWPVTMAAGARSGSERACRRDRWRCGYRV